MDASKYISATGDEKRHITDSQAIRIAIADSLRDLADEIETGTRAVSEIITFEKAQANQFPISILTLQTILRRIPATMKQSS